jgi:hypothetical protein
MELRIMVAAGVTILAGCGRQPVPKAAAKEPDPVQITSFYASPSSPFKGEKTMLCYGVANAEQVTIDPPVDRVWPSFNRCIEATPAKETIYTLTASRGTARVSQSVTVTPGPKPPRILEATIDHPEVARGGMVMVCFKAKEASDITIRPGEWMLPHDLEVGCVTHHPQEDTTYVVTATGPGGKVTQKLTAKVR